MSEPTVLSNSQDSEHPSVPLTEVSKLSPFRENKIFGASEFFQTVLDAA